MKVEDILTPEQDPSGVMAEFAANLKYEDIPADLVDYIKRDILDAMSSFLGGSTGPNMDTVMESVRSYGVNGCGGGRVLVFGDRLPETLAAFANGTMARGVDLGDTGVTGGHVCEWVVPTLLSALKRVGRPVSGKEFITAFLAGAEWGTREHTTIRLQPNNKLVPGECAGSRYAVVALGKMYGFDKEQIWDAVGAAYSITSMTTQQKAIEGKPDVRLQHGYFASNAVQMCDLISRGLPSVHGIYMGQSGLLKSIFHHNIESPDVLTQDLGKRWLFQENITNKLYAGCYYNHTAMYGVLTLMKENGLKREDIAGIHVVTSPAGELTWVPRDIKYRPATPEGGMFSTPYSLARAVFYGDCFLDAYEPEHFRHNMEDPEFLAFMDCITQSIDPAIKPAFDDYYVTIRTRDGREFTRQVCDTPGNQKNPMTWDQAIDKFRKCQKYSAVDLGQDKYEQVVEICRNLDTIKDVSVLVDAMTPDGE